MDRGSRILISNLAPIGAKEREFFGRLVDAFVARGCEVWLWTTAEITLPNATVIPFRWDLGRSLATQELLPRDLSPALYRLDTCKWRPRLTRLIKQSFHPAQTDQVLRQLASYSWKLLREVRPDLFLVWNPHCPHMGVAADFATSLGIPTMLLERGILPDTWFFEHGSLLGGSVLANLPLESISRGNLEEARSIGQCYLSQVSFADFNRYPQASSEAFDREVGQTQLATLRPRIAFFPPDDLTVGFLPSEHDDRLRTLFHFSSSLDASMALAGHSPGTVVFKPHPSFPRPFEAPHQPSNHRVVDCDFRVLIDWADVVAGSGSGLELVALIRGKPIILTANEILRGKGVAYEYEEGKDMRDLLRDAFEDRRRDLHQYQVRALVGVLLRDHLLSTSAADPRHLTPERAVDELWQTSRFRAQAC